MRRHIMMTSLLLVYTWVVVTCLQNRKYLRRYTGLNPDLANSLISGTTVHSVSACAAYCTEKVTVSLGRSNLHIFDTIFSTLNLYVCDLFISGTLFLISEWSVGPLSIYINKLFLLCPQPEYAGLFRSLTVFQYDVLIQ